MRPGICAAVLLAVTAAGAAAQVPSNVSPNLSRAVSRTDSTVRVWLIARAGTDPASLAEAARERGARVRHVSRFVGAVSVEVRGGALRSLATIPGLRRIQPVAIYVRQRTPVVPPGAPSVELQPRVAEAADTLYGPGGWAVRRLGIPLLHSRGLFGAGVRIALLDAGFNTLHPFMSGARVVAQRDFVYSDSVVRDQPGEAQGEMAHGTRVWSLLAANAPGRLFGVAPAADFLLAKTEFTLTETRIEEDNWVAALEWADSLGVHIVASSLGYRTFDGSSGYGPAQLNGDIAVTTVAADAAAGRGILVVVSVGNGGPTATSLTTPADGDSVVAVGATDSLGAVPSFSSRGPTADGRVKPDVIAPGIGITVAGTDSGTTLGSGTSFSAPLIAGLAALVQETRGGRPATDLRVGLIDAGDRRHAADNVRGHGIPTGLRLLTYPRGIAAAGPPSGNLDSPTPTLSWNVEAPAPGLGPILYRVRVGSDSGLRTILLDTTISTTSLPLPFPLLPGARIFWRVVAASPLGAIESTSVRGPLLSPHWVTMLTLASPQGHSIRDSLPRLAWQSPPVASPPGPFRYDVYVYPASRGPSEVVVSARGLADTTFRPTVPLERNLPYRWRVVAHAGRDSVVVTSPGTFVVLDESAPVATVLFQNFPNPFPSAAAGVNATCIWFDIAREGEVRLEVFDLRGRLIRRLAPSGVIPSVLAPGRYGRPPADTPGTCDPRFTWDGVDETGAYVRPGVYVVRLLGGGTRETKRAVFLGRP